MECYLHFSTYQKKNPNSYTEIKIDTESNFQNEFMTIAAYIEGFMSYISPIIVVDGTLKMFLDQELQLL